MTTKFDFAQRKYVFIVPVICMKIPVDAVWECLVIDTVNNVALGVLGAVFEYHIAHNGGITGVQRLAFFHATCFFHGGDIVCLEFCHVVGGLNALGIEITRE